MKIYIAGKVTGMHINHCTMKFGAAQMKLEKKGNTVVNPLEVVNDWKCPWPKAMRLCIAAMMECDAVYALDNWKDSAGATIEVELAKKVGLEIFYQEKTIAI